MCKVIHHIHVLVELFFSYDVLLKVVITLMTLSAQKSYNASNLFSSRNHGVYNDINPHPAMIEKGQDLYFNAPLRKKWVQKVRGRKLRQLWKRLKAY